MTKTKPCNMSDQEVFDHVLIHCVVQGKPALNEEGNCMYFNSEGECCAVGCLLTRKLYDTQIKTQENHVYMGVDNLPKRIQKYLGIQSHKNREDLLINLQELHDESGNWDESGPNEEFWIHATKIAIIHNLNVNEASIKQKAKKLQSQEKR